MCTLEELRFHLFKLVSRYREKQNFELLKSLLKIYQCCSCPRHLIRIMVLLCIFIVLSNEQCLIFYVGRCIIVSISLAVYLYHECCNTMWYEWIATLILGLLGSLIFGGIVLLNMTDYKFTNSVDRFFLYWLQSETNGTRKPYINGILKYVLNDTNKNKEILKRIIAVNYYLMSMFIDDVKEIDPTQINCIADIHNKNIGVGLTDMKWTDIRHIYNHKNRNTYFILFHLLTVSDILMVVFLFIFYFYMFPIWLIICCAIYVCMEIICLINDIKYCLLHYYCYHLLPFINRGNIEYIAWTSKFKNVDQMLRNINIIYQIMFCHHEIEAILQNLINIPLEIVTVVAQYLGHILPLYHHHQIDDCIDVNIRYKLNDIINAYIHQTNESSDILEEEYNINLNGSDNGNTEWFRIHHGVKYKDKSCRTLTL